ncbi:Fe-S-containing hydro-lyase [Desulforamulus hydrothermalis]|uniref:Hydro-lyase, Fe-S type, tartrate/fumarate subfamily, beta subunit n=1 Tax=Desulforamulus hydrothermalis Lam5 = DSM 18033 TaxID=1121428 RepID=K8EE36_9FIRM|nr:Fe-S-containing hydro-lyase [Desulforamulus hydrothermalis]CCO07061.1 Hydro-lyase, Fe-S type, tartrate/fumarate subfamily, beta subunit [Desulforamulus hydrothermalis Lam5 = DSM 18033]SHH40445.1 fumarate hydratase subunit beta [Desulforamulus hydrothermalis Lam5 = DSM 18033]
MTRVCLTTPLSDAAVANLRIGQQVLINGVIYTGRDAAHKRLVELLEQGKDLPVDLRGQIIYYVGPSPAPPGKVIGSAGPTTAGRMDAYTPRLIELGLKGMIGKGARSETVKEAMQKYRAVYFAAVGGAAALIAKCIKQAEVVAYADLGPEAIYKLTVQDFPAIVVNDAYGGDLYQEGRKIYAEE